MTARTSRMKDWISTAFWRRPTEGPRPGRAFSWARGTSGDQLKRALSGALLRYTEGYYADGGNKTTLWKSARASCGEAATAVQILAMDGSVPANDAIQVRELLSRAMRMFTRLLRPL